MPKDGPSAGIGMVTSIVSTLTGIPVRADVAMTGEVTLRGRVLPIGGLKEKLLAALRGGIKTVLIPEENEKDLAEIPANVKEGLEIVPVSHVDEVLRARAGRAARGDRMDRGGRPRQPAGARPATGSGSADRALIVLRRACCIAATRRDAAMARSRPRCARMTRRFVANAPEIGAITARFCAHLALTAAAKLAQFRAIREAIQVALGLHCNVGGVPQ